jgi:transcriptional regulator with XRE-family HTH domain
MREEGTTGSIHGGTPTKREVAAAFGALLQRCRHVREMTQEELAAASGVSTQYVSMMERGQYQPSLHTVLCLARALDMRAADLVANVSVTLGEWPPEG